MRTANKKEKKEDILEKKNETDLITILQPHRLCKIQMRLHIFTRRRITLDRPTTEASVHEPLIERLQLSRFHFILHQNRNPTLGQMTLEMKSCSLTRFPIRPFHKLGSCRRTTPEQFVDRFLFPDRIFSNISITELFQRGHQDITLSSIYIYIYIKTKQRPSDLLVFGFIY